MSILRDPSVRPWLLAAALLVATFGTMTFAGATYVLGAFPARPSELGRGLIFAVPMMAILLTHELGHYVAARRHGVAVSPPFFIPMPLFLGTFGAVLLMPGRIPRRAALLDIGAAGPLAGLVVAIPVLAYGLSVSEIVPNHPDMTVEGRSLLYLFVRRLAVGPIPDGHDVLLSAPALAGWGGLLVTMMNLLPIGQLDGGHVAYALAGRSQDGWSRRLHRFLPGIGLAVGVYFAAETWWRGGDLDDLVTAASSGVHWIVWAGVLALLFRFSGEEHPPTDPGPLDAGRRGIGVFTLVMFALLFMPSWLRVVP